MNTLSPLRFLLFALGAATASGQTVSTDPVGFIPVTAKGNSDTIISTPLHRAADFRGTVASLSGDTLTINSATFVIDAFNGSHYVLIASGDREGMWYAVTDTTATTLKVDLAGDDLTGHVANGTEIEVIPFWTLNTVFPEGSGVHASPTFRPGSRVLIPDAGTAGIKLASSASYFYYSGTASGGEGWRKFGAVPSQKFDDQILIPDTHFIIRHEVPTDTLVTNLGSVQMTSLATVIGTLQAGQAQDNTIAFNVAVPTSLLDSGLFGSGVFAGSSDIDVPADLLLVFDNSVAGKNKTPSAIYFYYTGTGNGGAGWRKQGDPATTIHNATQAFQPANGYVLRKAATTPAQAAIWQTRPGYVPQ
ncbi:MAG: TIGR02597 family protein [Verrucomicrobiales bacterium]